MIKKKAIFRNLFSNHTITPQRLYNFGHFVSIALATLNTAGEYTVVLSELEPVLQALQKENSNIDTGLTTQVNSTKSVDELMAGFIEFMKDAEPVIARALGGRKSAGYHAFYPHTVVEYDNTNKSNITLFTGRICKAAETHKDALGEKLTNELQAFAEEYRKARGEQQGQIAMVGINRGKRRKYFVRAQWALTAAVHYVAFANRAKPAASNGIFPFDMLYPKTKHKLFRLEARLAAGATGEILNASLNKRTAITVRNTGANANIYIWAAAKADDEMPADALVVKPMTGVNITAAMRANWKGNLLLVKNDSAANEAHYKIDITGLSKKRLPAKAIEMVLDDEPEALPLQMIG